MKKLIALIILCFLFASNVSAHPGRTDSKGGHTCRTNCEKWGLSYGEYHYHNGGGSSSGSSSAKAPSYNAKAEHDKGYKAGYKIGYEKGYNKDSSATEFTYTNPEYKEGWNEGFKEGQKEGGAQKEKEEQEEQDKRDGNKEGLLHGEENYGKGLEKNEITKTSFPSPIYEKAYRAAHEIGWELGRNKREYSTLGYEQGLLTDSIELPSDMDNEVLIEVYKNGFANGVAERDETEVEIYREMGQTDGINDVHNPPANVKSLYIEAYQTGYKDGFEKLKQKYTHLGYEAAFTNLNYVDPAYSKGLYNKWHQEGFNSNTEVVELQQIAFKMGRSGESIVPGKYEHASEIFGHYLSLGNEQGKKDTRNGIAAFSLIVVGWVLRRFYIAWKMIR